jgi:hypothetical protein
MLQGCKVLYRETKVLLDELADAVTEGTHKEYVFESISTVPLLIIDLFGLHKLPHPAAEDVWKSSCAAANISACCLLPILPSRLGQTARQCRRGERHARSSAAARPGAQKRSPGVAQEKRPA